ncbi:Succinate dehydrogenase [ubiquinone] iron-sulfur subunit, mitochondrial [Mycena indigotica]|uniref:Succinate dehydrogenase [ubiquinone] iron-sulfur subunit, mitochondrial n=1 Tax=Mycena indigotica TaxID=2126181 RepID=A0A8H6T2E8_9AGAR|nr:Succinate dehydrogenase [ubiquinone] iron-sulfur subunit, mitochondrial [Mycena indigotica]KAF7309664.1 Succinate dehydrogenase [ubiquinone] iron-sulfur subunit, mitochondrial [Mycena indigotica]
MPFQRRVSRCLARVVPSLVVLYVLFSEPSQVPPESLSSDWTNLVVETKSLSGSLTAVVPITRFSLSAFEDTLATLIRPSACITKVLVTCPEPLLSQTRRAIQHAVRAVNTGLQPDITLHPSAPNGETVSEIVKAISTLVATEKVLVLDETGFDGLSERTKDLLLCPAATHIPIGPRGVISINHTCVVPSSQLQPATYLLPPFTISTSLVKEPMASWAAMGVAVSRSLNRNMGGVVRSFGDQDANYCGRQFTYLDRGNPPSYVHETTVDPGLFFFLLPNYEALQLILPTIICPLHRAGHTVRVLVHSNDRIWGPASCTVRVEFLGKQNDAPLMLQMTYLNLILCKTVQLWSASLKKICNMLNGWVQCLCGNGYVYVSVGIEHLLDLNADWNTPRIELSVITQDRPRSLRRLLSSLTRARFLGDSVNIRLNMEQSSDTETIQIVRDFTWRHGTVFTHRRVVHGGLIPAVVESWYPHSNHEYGVLLEDDVELSPLFYIWIKMAILRYRYGEGHDRSKDMFGISLYHQKNTELHPDGRKPFNPRSLFEANHIQNPSTPYLSQVPCSWGAVYFPEHWREFHDYLANRLSEHQLGIDKVVVPNVRSNNWSRSWKKYFIELVYLRSYVMLYPNYADFGSFSTNHVEVGSHVKNRPKEKQDAFRVPLLELEESWRLVEELPGKTLPPWDKLPVVNLTGFLS